MAELTAALIEELTREGMRKLASKGGKARARKLSAERLREIAMMGVKARRAKREGREGKAA